MASKQTKKSLKRHGKTALMKFAKENGLEVNKKDTKTALVEKIWKNKGLRDKLEVKGPRPLSEKQKANLAKFRKGSDYKNEEKIKQRAQYVAEIAKIEDVMPQGNRLDEDLKKAIGAGKGQRIENQKQKLQGQIKENAKTVVTEGREFLVSSNKTTDLFDQSFKDVQKEKTIQRIKAAEIKAKQDADKRFGQEDVPSSESGENPNTIAALENTDITQLVAKLKDLKRTDPTNPLVFVIEGMLREKKKLVGGAVPVAAPGGVEA